MVTDDPIGRMFKRGQLRRKTAQDGKTAKARLRAARMWQSIYADLPGTQLNPDKRKAAQAMSELQDHLGEYRSLLLRRVLGEKLQLDAVASLMLGIAAPVDLGARSIFAKVLLANFLNSLDALAGYFGSKPIHRLRFADICKPGGCTQIAGCRGGQRARTLDNASRSRIPVSAGSNDPAVLRRPRLRRWRRRLIPLSGSTRQRVTVMDGFADWDENS